MAACYRHPGRETNVTCSRCGRAICPDCMTPSPVGMRCPECARDRTQVRRAVAGTGGGATPATYGLIGLSVLAFVGELVGGGGAASLDGGGELIRDGGLFGPAIEAGEPWRIVTSGFLHAGPLHLALNMFALYFLGSLLEPGIGTPRFVGVYFVSLLGGSLGALLVDPLQLTVGASGAVFGLMAAAFVVARQRGMQGVASEIALFVGINLVFTFSIPNISIGGHVGGLIAGGLAALAITQAERSRRRSAPLEAAVLVGLAAVMLAGSLLAAGASDPVGIA